MFAMTPDELLDRFSVADLIEQTAFDVLAAEDAEEAAARYRRQRG